MRILIPDAIYPGEPTIEQAACPPGTIIDARRGVTPADIPDETWRACDAILIWQVMALRAETIAKLDNCRIIARAGVGFDGIDLAAAAAKGIAVCNCPDYGTTDVADHAIALYLALLRGIVFFQDALRADVAKGWDWTAPPLIGRVRGRCFGVIGMGRIGTAAARRARGLDMPVLFYDPYVPDGQELALGFERTRSLENLLERADVVSLHTPLTDETRRLINAATLGRMRKQSVLINTARGAVVDIDALHEALKSDRIAGAGLDVLPQEPPDANHPLIRAFRGNEPWLAGRFLLSPHAAFYSEAGMADLRRKPMETVVAYLTEGKLRNCVNLGMLERAHARS
ncbi:MAG: C-terminal binding protein [Dongiaceae bacterium]